MAIFASSISSEKTIQGLTVLKTCLPTRQDGFRNRYKVYMLLAKLLPKVVSSLQKVYEQKIVTQAFCSFMSKMPGQGKFFPGTHTSRMMYLSRKLGKENLHQGSLLFDGFMYARNYNLRE